MEIIIDRKFGRSSKLCASIFVQHNRGRQILTFTHHRHHTHILHQARLLQTHFHFRERNTLFFNLYNRIRTALEQESAIIIKVHQITCSKAFGFQNIARFDVQATVFGNTHFANFKRSPHRSILGLPICNATRLGTTVNFHRPKTRQFTSLASHLFGQRTSGRINNRRTFKINRLIRFCR